MGSNHGWGMVYPTRLIHIDTIWYLSNWYNCYPKTPALHPSGMTKSSRSCLARWAPREDPTAWGASPTKRTPKCRSGVKRWMDIFDYSSYLCDSYDICDSYVIHMWLRDIPEWWGINWWYFGAPIAYREKLAPGHRPHPLIRGTVAPSVPAGYSCCILRQFGQLAYPVNPCLSIRFQTVKTICQMDFLLGVWVSNFKSHRNCKSRS